MIIPSLSSSELKLMNIIWSNEPLSASDLAELANKKIGWHKNTTYTIIKRLIAKKMVVRSDEQYICKSRVSRQEAEAHFTRSLINEVFNGSRKAFISAFIENEKLDEDEINRIKNLIDRAK